MPVRWRILDDWTGLELGVRHAMTAADDQRLFRLPWRYFPGSGDLVVHVNGVLQLPGVDYEETGEQTVTFLWGLRSGDRVTFFPPLLDRWKLGVFWRGGRMGLSPHDRDPAHLDRYTSRGSVLPSRGARRASGGGPRERSTASRRRQLHDATGLRRLWSRISIHQPTCAG